MARGLQDGRRRSLILFCLLALAGLSLPAAAAQSQTLDGSPVSGSRSAIAIFAGFSDEATTDQAPAWSTGFFDVDQPGSFSHFYHTMSFGRLRIDGDVAARRYMVSQPASAYLAARSTEAGGYPRFAREVLAQADGDIDFSRYDNDGPDGIPNSGDDDGQVDAVFLMLASTPANFLRGPATGLRGLGLDGDYLTDDRGVDGTPIRIPSAHGTFQRARGLDEAVGTACHEYGHVLGLQDLFDVDFLGTAGAPPEEDSAGIGAWGLMGWGANGWQGGDGPTSLSAFHRLALGWATLTELGEAEQTVRLPDVGQRGDVVRVPVGAREWFLLEYRTRASSYYDRKAPGEGLLIWHVIDQGNRHAVDLETADGRWHEAGFPLGRTPQPTTGGDNLDFWAHDAAYRERFGGNLGDAGDPFDGVRYTRFGPDTNPDSRSTYGRRSIVVDAIRRQGDVLTATVKLEPARLEIREVLVLDDNLDGVVLPGEQALVRTRITNVGGVPARGVELEMALTGSLAVALNRHTAFGDLGLDKSTLTAPTPGFPRFVGADVASRGSVRLDLTVRSDNAPSTSTTVHVDMMTAAHVIGQVTDPHGQPVTGLRFDCGRGCDFVTDDRGTFSISVTPGLRTFRSSAPEPSLGLARYQESHQLTPDSRPLSLELRQQVVLRGTVTDEEGTPVKDVSITALPSTSRRTTGVGTDARGDFELTASAGTSRFRVRPPLRLALEGYADFELGPLALQGDRRLDLVLRRGIAANLLVTDGAGKPVMSTISSGGLRTWARSGRLTERLLPGAHLLSIHPRGVADLSAARVLLQDPAATAVVTLPVVTTLSGELLGGSSATDLEPRLLFAASTGDVAMAQPLTGDGTFTARLPPGRYRVTYLPGASGRTPAQVVDTVDVPGVVHLRVDPGYEVALSLAHASGEPLSGHHVWATSADADLATLGTMADGQARLRARPGRYRLSVTEHESRRMWSLARHVDLAAGHEGLASLPGGGIRVAGRVPAIDEFDADALVEITDDPRRPTRVLSLPGQPPFLISTAGAEVAGALVAAGEAFDLEAPAGASHLVALSASGQGTGSVLAVATSARTWITPEPPAAASAKLYGTITAPAGVLRGEVVLRLFDERSGTVVQWRDGHVDGSGEFAVGGRAYVVPAPPGSYQVRIGMFEVTAGFYAVFDLGTVEVDSDQRWDIDLTQRTTLVEPVRVAVPQAIALDPSYPNPFNPATVIPFSLTAPEAVRLTIHNAIGQQLRTLVAGAHPAGRHRVAWDGLDGEGRGLGAGVYIVRLQVGSHVQTRKVLMLK